MREITMRAFSRAASIFSSAVEPIFTHFCRP